MIQTKTKQPPPKKKVFPIALDGLSTTTEASKSDQITKIWRKQRTLVVFSKILNNLGVSDGEKFDEKVMSSPYSLTIRSQYNFRHLFICEININSCSLVHISNISS